jgi:hypothetical protein
MSQLTHEEAIASRLQFVTLNDDDPLRTHNATLKRGRNVDHDQDIAAIFKYVKQLLMPLAGPRPQIGYKTSQ